MHCRINRMAAGWTRTQMATTATTINREVSMTGVGLHSGRTVCLTLAPAAGGGIVFVRTDLSDVGVRIPAGIEHVVATRLSTTIGQEGAEVQTIEHLMSAISALGIDHLLVRLDGPEVPIADGSALPFVALLKEAGRRQVAGARTAMAPTSEVDVCRGERRVKLRPATELSITCTIQFDHPQIGRQTYRYEHSPEAFVRDIAPARTFCFERDVAQMRGRGQALGGSLDNAIVLTENGMRNDGPLRFPDEFVRHKILDLIGDLALLGRPLVGAVEAVCAGHALHAEFVRRIQTNESTSSPQPQA